MDDAEFLHNTVGLLAYQLRETVTYIGSLNALLIGSADDEISKEATALDPGIDELFASVKRITDAFPPPPGMSNGRPRK